MEHAAAVNLIRNNYISSVSSRWADLGAGNGTFTRALADLLPPTSVIEAIDQRRLALEEIPSSFQGVRIVKKKIDLSSHELPGRSYDGVILANTLHFFQDQMSLLKKIQRSLKEAGVLIIVEYELDTASPWVPYPIPYYSLRNQLSSIGFSHIIKLRDHPSIYGGRTMYSTLATTMDRGEFQQQDELA